MNQAKILLALFCATFVIGGTSLVSAYTTGIALNGLKADFLGDPHYTPSYTKQDWSPQQVQVTTTTGNREVQLAEFTESGKSVSGDIWIIFKSGVTKEWADSSYQIPTSFSGEKYKIGAKLQWPWVQTKVEDGLWVLDY